MGILKSTSFTIPVIAVGNLSVGGTGKTPQTEYLIRLLQSNKKIAVLSRGYRRKTRGFILLNSKHDAETVGDEPLQFFKKFPAISVVVDANRVHGIQQLQKLIKPDVILLDDAFQHRKLKAGLYILLTKYGDLYTDDFLLPVGNLREHRSSAKRAHIIVVTKCPEKLSESEQKRIRKKLKTSRNQCVFFSSVLYPDKTKGSKEIAIEDLKKYEILLVTGIANPTPLVRFLDSKSIRYKHLKYPDHHHFSGADIAAINTVYINLSSAMKLILTTEKDYVRLSDAIKNLSYLEIETKLLNNQIEFERKILEQLPEW